MSVTLIDADSDGWITAVRRETMSEKVEKNRESNGGSLRDNENAERRDATNSGDQRGSRNNAVGPSSGNADKPSSLDSSASAMTTLTEQSSSKGTKTKPGLSPLAAAFRIPVSRSTSSPTSIPTPSLSPTGRMRSNSYGKGKAKEKQASCSREAGTNTAENVPEGRASEAQARPRTHKRAGSRAGLLASDAKAEVHASNSSSASGSAVAAAVNLAALSMNELDASSGVCTACNKHGVRNGISSDTRTEAVDQEIGTDLRKESSNVQKNSGNYVDEDAMKSVPQSPISPADTKRNAGRRKTNVALSVKVDGDRISGPRSNGPSPAPHTPSFNRRNNSRNRKDSGPSAKATSVDHKTDKMTKEARAIAENDFASSFSRENRFLEKGGHRKSRSRSTASRSTKSVTFESDTERKMRESRTTHSKDARPPKIRSLQTPTVAVHPAENFPGSASPSRSSFSDASPVSSAFDLGSAPTGSRSSIGGTTSSSAPALPSPTKSRNLPAFLRVHSIGVNPTVLIGKRLKHVRRSGSHPVITLTFTDDTMYKIFVDGYDPRHKSSSLPRVLEMDGPLERLFNPPGGEADVEDSQGLLVADCAYIQLMDKAYERESEMRWAQDHLALAFRFAEERRWQCVWAMLEELDESGMCTFRTFDDVYLKPVGRGAAAGADEGGATAAEMNPPQTFPKKQAKQGKQDNRKSRSPQRSNHKKRNSEAKCFW